MTDGVTSSLEAIVSDALNRFHNAVDAAGLPVLRDAIEVELHPAPHERPKPPDRQIFQNEGIGQRLFGGPHEIGRDPIMRTTTIIGAVGNMTNIPPLIFRWFKRGEAWPCSRKQSLKKIREDYWAAITFIDENTD